MRPGTRAPFGGKFIGRREKNDSFPIPPVTFPPPRGKTIRAYITRCTRERLSILLYARRNTHKRILLRTNKSQYMFMNKYRRTIGVNRFSYTNTSGDCCLWLIKWFLWLPSSLNFIESKGLKWPPTAVHWT